MERSEKLKICISMENLLLKKREWEIVEREPNTIYVASISYGKDSLAMLEAIKKLGYRHNTCRPTRNV